MRFRDSLKLAFDGAGCPDLASLGLNFPANREIYRVIVLIQTVM